MLPSSIVDFPEFLSTFPTFDMLCGYRSPHYRPWLRPCLAFVLNRKVVDFWFPDHKSKSDVMLRTYKLKKNWQINEVLAVVTEV